MAPDKSVTNSYAEPVHRYSFALSASFTLPVSINANSPGTIPVGAVSACNANIDVYIFATLNPNPVAP